MSDAAYLAGLIDGEGSIILYMRRDVVAMMLTVANTCRAVLEWVHEKTGVGDVNVKPRPSVKHKDAYVWRCNADAAESVLQQVKRYLVIKPIQAELALEVQQRLRDPQLKADRTWHLDYCKKMRALNKRGPVEKVP